MITSTITRATVIERSMPMQGAVELVLKHPEAAAITRPGQFFMLGVGAQHALLRRPYSISSVDRGKGQLAFLFNIVGSGSAWLAEREAGQPVDLLGPLGKGFTIEDNDRPALCVAGGLGIAAFPALIAELVRLGRPVHLLYGARSSSRLLPVERFPRVHLSVATDDGSSGVRGMVSQLLRESLDERVDVFACGPTPMLLDLVEQARARHPDLNGIEIALETPMGCGFGTCLGCAVPAAGGGYLLACQAGPCVRAGLVDWKNVVDVFHG